MMNIKKRGLGKGLNELGINELLSDINTSLTNKNAEDLRQLPLDLLQPGKYQPRQEFNPESLQELAASIRSQGIIQPLVVRPVAQQRYEIIAGERRWRAAQIAGLAEVPVIIRDIPDNAAIAMALIENIQRENLHPMEEARSLQRLISEFDMTHEQAADVVGKARVTVTNLLRLLSLNPDVKDLLEKDQLEMGHAKALLGLHGLAQSEAAKIIVSKQLTVRAAEELVRKFHTPKIAADKSSTQDPNVLRLQENLSDKLGAAVTIAHQTSGKGQLIIRYNSLDELEGILEHIK